MKKYTALLFISLYSFALCQDAFKYKSTRLNRIMFQNYLSMEKDKGHNNFQFGNDEYKYVYNYKILLGQNEINEMELLELLEMEEKLNEFNEDFSQKIKEYELAVENQQMEYDKALKLYNESKETVYYYDHNRETLNDNQSYFTFKMMTALIGAIIIYVSIKIWQDQYESKKEYSFQSGQGLMGGQDPDDESRDKGIRIGSLTLLGALGLHIIGETAKNNEK